MTEKEAYHEFCKNIVEDVSASEFILAFRKCVLAIDNRKHFELEECGRKALKQLISAYHGAIACYDGFLSEKVTWAFCLRMRHLRDEE